jgi:hypothetical protein
MYVCAGWHQDMKQWSRHGLMAVAPSFDRLLVWCPFVWDELICQILYRAPGPWDSIQNVAKFPLLHRGPFVTTLHTQHLLVNASWCFCNKGRSERPGLVLTASPAVRHIWVIKSNCLRVGLRLSILFFMESNLHIAKKLEKKTLIYWRVSTVAHYALGHGH